MSSIDGARQQLEQAYQELMAKWGRTSSAWRDAKSREFERQYLAPLQPDVRLAMDAMRELRQLVNTTREDCE